MDNSDRGYKKVGILEFDKRLLGVRFGRMELIFILLAVASLLLFVFVIRIPGLGVDASYAAGVLLFLALLYICKAMNNGIVVILGTVVIYLLRLMDAPTLFAQIGNSAVTMLLPMLILSYAVSSTAIGKRLTLFIIRKWGNSPRGLVMSFSIAASVLSMFILDWPVIIMLTPIARQVLIELGEMPGKRSKLGTALMAAILLGATIGGEALVNGSSVNPAIIALVETVTEGAMTVSYVQWALIGIPCALVTTPVCTWTINWCCGINDKLEIKEISLESVERDIKELGSLKPSEKRFIATLILLITMFFTSGLTGISMVMCAMIASVLCCVPGWGFVNAKEAFQNVDWVIILMTIGVQLQGVLAMDTGLGEWLVNLFVGWSLGGSLFILSLTAIMTYAFVTFATTTIPYAIIIPGLVPLCSAVGINPMGPIMAVAMVQAYYTHTPWHSAPQLVYSDGYWEYKDFLKAGWITLIPYALLIALACSLLTGIVFK